MPKNKKILIAQMTCVFSVIPALIWAHEYGPDPFHTSAPGDNPTSCIEAQCHVGTLNSFGGNVALMMPNGNTYTPGQTQRITVTITDSAQKSWGFQLTARLARDPKNAQAGDFNSFDATTQVLCANSSLRSTATPCPSAFPLQFAEHTMAGWSKSRGSVGSYSYQVDWTAPATDVGDVMLYVGANASNSTLNPAAGHIYTASLKLSALVNNGAKPAITSSGGVVNGATNLPSGIAPNTYISIFGSNLASTTRVWAGSDFGASGAKLPTSLDGTSVMVNGKPAYVEYISPTQINAITPSDSAAGSGVTVRVSRNDQTSDSTTITLSSVAPGFFTFDGKYVAAAATRAGTNVFIGKTGLFPSAPNLTTPAKPGETITLYGTGFGPTSPAIADGLVTDKIYNLSPTPVINIGGSPAAVGFAALTPGFAQVYQFNVTIPASAPDGDLQIFAQASGVSSPNTNTCCFVTVKK
ncbi:MAG: IPT/TIG domain-containing protein [Acidobacteriota bacterium]|nr:IPT/TIG domain-containing protein [Acidobacteriota bacterium]